MHEDARRVSTALPSRGINHRAVSDLTKITALAFIYFVAGKLGLKLAFLNQSASAVWPPTGIALAAVLLLGYRLWPGIWIGAFLVNITTTGSLPTTVCIAGGNTLEILLGAWLIQRFANGWHAVERTRDIIRFALLAALSTLVGATVGVTSLALAGFAHWNDYTSIWTTWWFGDVVSALVITPLLVFWFTTPLPRWERKRYSEAALALTLVFGICLLGFDGPKTAASSQYPRFLMYPASLWAAYRFRQRGAVSASFLVSGLAIWGTLHGLGPFASADANRSLLSVQAWMGAYATTLLVLGTVVSEREQSEAELENWRRHLESRVEERTRELVLAHKELQIQIEERKRLEVEVARATEREQLRLGQELHDGLGQQLAGISYMMNALQTKLESASAPAAKEAEKVESLILKSVEQVRCLAKGFYPVELERNGLLFALEDMARTTEQMFDVRCILQAESAGVDRKDALAIQLFRIAQEAVHNAVKHARAKQITIRLVITKGENVLSIIDDGIGLPSGTVTEPRGMGLRIMRYRARMIGGTLEIRNGLDGGVIVTCSFPTAEQAGSSDPQLSNANQSRLSIRT